jgi:hypothetical protein
MLGASLAPALTGCAHDGSSTPASRPTGATDSSSVLPEDQGTYAVRHNPWLRPRPSSPRSD